MSTKSFIIIYLIFKKTFMHRLNLSIFTKKMLLNITLLSSLTILSTQKTFSQIITTIAGNGSANFTGDGGTASSSTLNLPYAITTANGNIYIADRNNQRIRKIDKNKVITTIAGNGIGTFSGDGGQATSASISNPYGLATDTFGNIYIADFSNNRIRKISTDGIISTVAGNGTATFNGDGGLATSASLNGPTGISVDLNGNIYIADYNNNRIRKVTITTGIITTVAGTGAIGFSGDGNLATSATFHNPYDVQVDKSGNLYIADFLNHRIRKVSTNGIINTFAGNGATGLGNGSFSGDGGLATSATLHGPTRLVIDTFFNVFIADYANHRIRKISTNGTISTIAGNGTAAFSGDGGLATSASINTPTGIALDSLGNLYIADLNNYRIRKVTNQVVPAVPSQIITTIAGTGSASFGGDGGTATSATLNLPYAVAVGSNGDVYLADRNNQRIRKINSSGIISTIAGNGIGTFSGDGGLATSASISNPYAIATDASGNIYFADWGNNRIRKIATNGIITTVAGNGTAGFSGDGSAATSASLNSPTGLCIDTSGNIYIADYGNNRVRKVSKNGIITTVAGNGIIGFSGDGSIATSANFYNPYDVAVDVAGNLYIADFLNHRIRKVSTNGIITTIAGSGATGSGNGSFTGDGSLATSATLHGPTRLALDTSLNIFIADYANHRIRKISSDGIISTITGTGTATYSGDGGLASLASINTPTGVALDASGNLYIADLNNYRIRKVTNAVLPLTLLSFTGQKQGNLINLKWVTTNEINTAAFIIQRSSDGVNFTNLSSVASKGNTSSQTDYTFIDGHPSSSKNYYRLKMMDKDGSFSYSSVIVFSLEDVSILGFKLSPNPARNYAQIQIASSKNEMVNIFVIDATGKTLLNQKNRLNIGINVISLNNISTLKSGLYYVITLINNETKTEKLLIAE